MFTIYIERDSKNKENHTKNKLFFSFGFVLKIKTDDKANTECAQKCADPLKYNISKNIILKKSRNEMRASILYVFSVIFQNFPKILT